MANSPGRYDHLPVLRYALPDGRVVLYRERRFLPPPPAAAAPGATVAEVRAGDRLDTVAGRHLGDPLQFWRLADANAAMDPHDLAEPGALLLVPNAGLGHGT